MTCTFSDEVKETFVEIVQTLCPSRGRTPKYSTENCLYVFAYVLQSGISWRHLKGFPGHYSTYYKRFVTWVEFLYQHMNEQFVSTVHNN